MNSFIDEKSMHAVATAEDLDAALETLVELEASLRLDHALPPNDVDQMRVSNRVSTTAIALAADIDAGGGEAAFAGASEEEGGEEVAGASGDRGSGLQGAGPFDRAEATGMT